MRKAVLAQVVLCLVSFHAVAQNPSPKSFETIPVNQIHAGMRGVAYTVFQGTKPEPMEVEVLGVLRNANGPKGDIILVRLGGEKAQYTGVVAGMSGSPVYLDGKLAGALAFRIGEFSKEPIAGVTPIGEMLEISAMDHAPAPDPIEVKANASTPSRTSGPGLARRPLYRTSRTTSSPLRRRWCSTGSPKMRCGGLRRNLPQRALFLSWAQVR